MLASGSKKFPCAPIVYLAKRAPHPYLGAMWSSFGTSRQCWKDFIQYSGDKIHTLQLYASNENCRKKRICAHYEHLPTLSPDAYNKRLCKGRRKTLNRTRRLFKKIFTWFQENRKPNTKPLLALGLESAYSKCAARRLVRIAKRVGFKKKQIVHNPDSRGYQGNVGAGLYEWHGVRQHGLRPSIGTLDGVRVEICQGNGSISGDSLSSLEVKRWVQRHRKSNKYLGLWCPLHQGLKANSQSVGDPRSRKFKVSIREVDRGLAIAGYKKKRK